MNIHERHETAKPWQNPDQHADQDVSHPAGEIMPHSGGLSMMARVSVLAGYVTLGAAVLGEVCTATYTITWSN